MKNYRLFKEQAFELRNKKGEIVPYIQNDAQRLYQEKRKNWNIILKIRQTGMTTEITGDYTIDFLTEPNIWCVTVSHEEGATERIFTKVKDYIDCARKNVKGLQLKLTKDSGNELYNDPNKAYYYIGTAGARSFGRGDTIQRLHLSELAHWKNTTILKGLLDAVPAEGSRIDIESTANGYGNAFQLMCAQAMAGDSAFNFIFIGLADVAEYSFSPELFLQLMGKEFVMNPVEKEIFDRYKHLGLTEGHLRFRRWKIASYSPEELKNGIAPEQLFMQEYPITPEEAFLSSGRPFFNMDALKLMELATREPIQTGYLDMSGNFI